MSLFSSEEPFAPIPFDPFRVGEEYGVREVTARLLKRGTPETRREHDWLMGQLEQSLIALEDVPEGMALRLRSRDGMAYLTFSSGLLGSGHIVSGMDALTGRSVFQVRGSGLAAPVAASVLRSVRGRVLGLKRPLRVVTRPKGAAMFDPALYRPDRLMAFRPRGLGRTDASRHARVDVMTCWVGAEALAGLLRALVVGVEVGREVATRAASPDVIHAYADDVVCPGY
ncbi:hypothetical protein [Streptomyces pseudogriseolus]|uniref:hypothetical protein n=1 Tax=Streptomyces pseudogriseolus TaxID=36817 RepID=UPI000A3B180F